MSIRGSSISLVREDDSPIISPMALTTKSWAELETFFKRERAAEGRQYKKEIPKQVQEYRGWVFSAVDCIADRMGSLSRDFYRRDTGEKLTSSSKVYKAITKPILYPNDYMSFEWIIQWCQIQLDLCGKAAILKKRNMLGMPWELWPLDMNYFEGIEYGDKSPDAPKNSLIPPEGYKFRVGNDIMLFPPENVIWLKYPHPEDIWDGFSPIQAQAYITDIDYYLEVYERGFFQNSARIDFILEHEGNISAEDAQRVKEEWTKAFGGSKRSYQPVVTGGGLRVVPLTFSNKDFQFIETAKWTRDRILGCYRVPAGKLGLFEDINRANQKGIDIAFNEGAIRPRLDLWDVEITRQLITEFTDKIEMKHENPVPRDREMDLKEFEAREGKYSIDEQRNWWDGSKPVDGGEVILIDSTKVPLTMAGVEPTDDSDKPADEDTPEYDTENDPGGDESDKVFTTDKGDLLIPHEGWDQVLDSLLAEYDRVLEYTNGWSWNKAYKYANEHFQIDTGEEVKKLFIDSIRDGIGREDFGRKVVSFLVEEVARKVDELNK